MAGIERNREVLAEWEHRLRLVRELGADGAHCFDLEAVDDEGQVSDSTRYTHDDFLLAAVDYNRQTVRRLEPQIAATMDAGLRLVDAVAAVDRQALNALLHDAFVMVDHRPISYPTLDKAGYCDGLVAQSDAMQVWVNQKLHAANTTAWLMHGSPWMLSFGEWCPYEQGLYLHVVADDQLTRIEIYPDDQLDVALDRFAELTPSPDSGG